MIRSKFTAELHCQRGRVGVADTDFRIRDRASFDQDGWLCTEDSRDVAREFKPVRFRFTFIKEESNRLHYYINAADTWIYKDSRLEQNKKGWLGLYGTGVLGRIIDAINPTSFLPQQQWKIETLQQWDGRMETLADIEFYLRNRHGYRVAERLSIYTLSTPTLYNRFLHAGQEDGEILKFHLHNVEVL